MAPLIHVLGAGGHGQDIAAVLRSAVPGVEIVFHDDRICSYPACSLTKDDRWVVGVNDPVTRWELATGCGGDPKLAYRAIHRWSSFAPGTVTKPGVIVGAGTHIGPGVTLGQHVHVGAGVTMTRVKVGAYTTISPGVDIAGDVSIGVGCLIGVGATVSNLVTIGDRCTVGAGAVVTRDVPDDTTVVGVPARPLQRKGAAA